MNLNSKTHDNKDDMIYDAEYETRSHSDTDDKPATRKMMKTTCSERDNRMITIGNDNENRSMLRCCHRRQHLHGRYE